MFLCIIEVTPISPDVPGTVNHRFGKAKRAFIDPNEISVLIEYDNYTHICLCGTSRAIDVKETVQEVRNLIAGEPTMATPKAVRADFPDFFGPTQLGAKKKKKKRKKKTKPMKKKRNKRASS